jgi:hypothetical protein
MAEEEGVFHRRVAMQGQELHIAALIENALRAVTVVVVHIQNGHPLGATVQHGLGGNGGVVEIAIAAHVIGRGMVAGRAAQRKGTVPGGQHGIQAGQRHIGRGTDGLPGAGGDGHPGIERVIAHQAVDILRNAVGTQAAHRPYQR